MATQYSFVTKWKTKAPIAQVWDAIRQSQEWPQWWPSFESVTEIAPGDKNNIGSIRRYTLKSPTGYRLTFDLTMTEIVEYKLLAGNSSGELEGTGAWKFEVRDGVTFIEYKWDVSTKKAWMNALAFLLKPAFTINHRMVMKKGAEYFGKRLGVEVNDIS